MSPPKGFPPGLLGGSIDHMPPEIPSFVPAEWTPGMEEEWRDYLTKNATAVRDYHHGGSVTREATKARVSYTRRQRTRLRQEMYWVKLFVRKAGHDCKRDANGYPLTRGLCRTCYQREWYHGRILDHDTMSRSVDEYVEEWEWLRDSGYTVPQAAARLKMNAEYLETLLRQARRAGDERAWVRTERGGLRAAS